MTALLAKSKVDAQTIVDGLIRKCVEGKSDRELEAIGLATLWSLDLEEVRRGFAEARELKAEPVTKPKPPKPNPWVRPLTKPIGPQIDAAQKVSGEGDFAERLNSAIEANKQAPSISPEPEPEPHPKAEPIKAGLPAVVPPVPPLSRWDDAIAAMNEQHALIENVGGSSGKTVIASWEPSPIDLNRLVVVFQTKESFLLRYSNRSISVEVPDGRGGTHYVRTPLGQWWLGHRDRLQFRGVTFRPGGPEVVNECLNLWQGWGVEPKPGDWGLIRQHIEEVVADGNAEFAEYLICWIAWAIQNPAAQAEVALVLIGAKGAGKGTLVRCLQRIFGAHAFQVTSREEVIGKFNGHLQDCVLFVADEAYWGGDKRCVGRLQGMITESTLPIERKGIDLIQVPNYLHVVMLAEPGWVIPAGRFERRYAALAVSDRRRGDREYFRALHSQIANGGAEAMMWDLQRMELDGWHPREIPESLLKGEALQEQQGHTLPPLEQWYLMLLHEGQIPGALIKRPNTAYTQDLLANARERIPRLRWDLSDVGLRNFLIDPGRIGVVCTKYRNSVGNGWSFPPLSECREAWAKLYGPQPWDDPAKEWRLPL
jgi:hypothetical protein